MRWFWQVWVEAEVEACTCVGVLVVLVVVAVVAQELVQEVVVSPQVHHLY